MKNRLIKIIYFLIFVVLVGIGGYLNNFTSPLVLGFYYSLVLMYGFYVFDNIFEIKFKKIHYFLMFIISFSGPGLIIILFRFSNYSDKILHFIHPIFLSFIVFFILSKLKIKKSYAVIITFFIVSSSFAIFEIIEYSADKIWDFKLQGTYMRDLSGNIKEGVIINPLDDTMIDLIMSFLGALSYLVFRLMRNRSNI